MNRIEFMARLEVLLQDIPSVERQEAIQYYNDYFDDAGAENEQRVIEELRNPERVSATIKAGLSGKNEENSEYGETGYTDTRFEEKETPAQRGTDYEYDGNGVEGRSSDKNLWKIIAIVLIVCIGIPIVLPVVGGVLAAVFGVLLGIFGVCFGLAIAGIALVFAGISLFVVGVTQLFTVPVVGLGLCGVGLILLTIGLLMTVGFVKLGIYVVPRMFRAVVEFVRRLVRRKEA